MGRIVEHSQDPPTYAKLHKSRALPDSSIQLVFYNQEKNGDDQSYKCGCIYQLLF